MESDSSGIEDSVSLHRRNSLQSSSDEDQSELEEEDYRIDIIRDEEWQPPCTLKVEYWARKPEIQLLKEKHTELLDRSSHSREHQILTTTPLKSQDVFLERNLFPYDTPTDIEHWTLWSTYEMRHREICCFIEDWCPLNHPKVVEWNYEENIHRSIDVPHVHVFFRCRREESDVARRSPSPPLAKPSDGSVSQSTSLSNSVKKRTYFALDYQAGMISKAAFARGYEDDANATTSAEISSEDNVHTHGDQTSEKKRRRKNEEGTSAPVSFAANIVP